MGMVSNTVANSTATQFNPVSEFGTSAAMGGGFALLGGGKKYLSYPVMGGGWNTRFATAAKTGALMPFGFEVNRRTGTSFMGWKDVVADEFAKGPGAHPTTFSQAWRSPATRRAMVGKAFGAALAIGFTVYNAYKGYQREGWWGATKAVGKDVIMFAGFEAGQAAVASLTGYSLGSLVWPAAAVAGAAYGTYKAVEWGRDTRRGLRRLEMVSPVVDPFGTGATMRQRSIAAIQKSYINGRIAMGNEAKLLHSPMLR